MWLVKARVRPGAEDALEDELTEGLAGGRPFAKELRKALAARAAPTAAFYFPVEGKEPENALGRDVLQHLEVVGKTRIHESNSGYGFDDEESRAPARPRPKPRRRASEEDD